AAEEMKQRAGDMEAGAGNAVIKTFHSFGAWLLRNNAHLIGLNRYFLIYDDNDRLKVLKDVAGDIKREELKQFAYWISRAKDSCIGPDENTEKITLHSDFRQVYGKYQKHLREAGNVDFGDLIMLPINMLKNNPEIRKRTRQRFKVILVDEYQDSNRAQFELLKQLYDGTNYICVVGDEDQSIYRFRGAEIDNILSFPEYFKGSETIRLEQNYRSTKKILNFASSVVVNNKNRLGKKLWTSLGVGSDVELVYLDDQDKEAEFCGEVVADKNYTGTAVLYRTNSQSRAFEEYFMNHGIPYRVVGTKRFYEREEVKDAVAYLALLVNPFDSVSFKRVINKPSRGVGVKTLKTLTHREDYKEELKGSMNTPRVNLLEQAEKGLQNISGRGARGVKSFLETVKYLKRRAASVPVAELVRMVNIKTGLFDLYNEKDAETGGSKVDNLNELINGASGYGTGMDELLRFLENVSLDPDKENPYKKSGAVTLITLHNTKGLEFERVVITGLEEGIFPHYSNSKSEEELEEERRLFYVGITRAKNKLYLTSCRIRRRFGKTENQIPSQFLDEIPAGFVKTTDRCIRAGNMEYPVGSVVYHYEYGTGIITDNWYNNGMLHVAVRFQSGRIGKFIPRYTQLERIKNYD
ncbi:MAG: UvrD-helicase domain-containing protein, partial [Spirochaetales bacterium]|nr:UvrD-helicase domain-containing protein [Spirochaetales bacterium]